MKKKKKRRGSMEARTRPCAHVRTKITYYENVHKYISTYEILPVLP